MTPRRSRSAPRSAGLLAVAVSAVCCMAATARADTPPSRWDRARDPATGDTYRIHLEVQRRLATSERDFGFSATHESEKSTVRTMLERAHAEKSPDVRLRFDLGHVYALLGRTEDVSLYRRAADVLNAALAIAPDHPAAEEAWGDLADVCGHIGDHECERRAYNVLLRLRTEEVERGTSILNLAETEMHLGNLKEAIDGYHEALRIAARYPSRTLAPLAMWGLAVALDRSGDRVGADKQALAVLQMQTSSGMTGLLRSSGVFFYPDYELAWYDGVGASAMARKATAPAEVARHWKAAEDAFATYVRGAQRRRAVARPAPAPAPGSGPSAATPAEAVRASEEDRWLELAKVRHAAAKLEREQAEKKRGKVPAEPQLDDDDEIPL